ncbi:hypothetical protein LXL04_017755 [Taraxacum kok-saghyz]
MDQNEARSTQDATIRSEAIHNQNKCKPKRKRMKQRSIGWDHFVKYTDKDGSTRARCKYCPNKTFACDSTNNGTLTPLMDMMAEMSTKKKLRKWFASTGQRVSLTTDTWTSLQRVNYMCLTAHFIDPEWNLHKKILNFCPILSHKGSQIGELIEKCLLDWGIDKLALKLRRAFVRFESADPQFKFELQLVGVPEEKDWKKVDMFVTFFKTFYDLTQRISGSQYVTSNTLFHEIIDVDSRLKKWIESTNSDFASMAKKMKVKYDKYWGDIGKTNMLIYVSVVLDPRHKLRYLDFVFSELQGHGDGSESVMSKNIKDATYELFCSYQKNRTTSMSNENTQRMSKEDVQETVITDMKESFESLSGGVEEKSELEKYLTEENMADSKGFCILMWWKINSNRFPVLSQMARDILAVPISTVASESTFSTGGRVLDSYRTSLSPKVVQALICTQDWIRKSHRSLNVEDET